MWVNSWFHCDCHGCDWEGPQYMIPTYWYIISKCEQDYEKGTQWGEDLIFWATRLGGDEAPRGMSLAFLLCGDHFEASLVYWDHFEASFTYTGTIVRPLFLYWDYLEASQYSLGQFQDPPPPVVAIIWSTVPLLCLMNAQDCEQILWERLGGRCVSRYI